MNKNGLECIPEDVLVGSLFPYFSLKELFTFGLLSRHFCQLINTSHTLWKARICLISPFLLRNAEDEFSHHHFLIQKKHKKMDALGSEWWKEKYKETFLMQFGMSWSPLDHTLIENSQGPLRDKSARFESKIAIFGDIGVGKTALILQSISGQFVPDYDPTISDSYRKYVTLAKRNFLLDFLDCPGQEEFSALREQLIRVSDVIVLAFDLTNKSSYESIKNIISSILSIREPPMVLVGNKLDLCNPTIVANSRKVAVSEALAFAKELNIPYFETSAKTAIGVHEMFSECCWACLTVTPREIPAKKKKKKCVVM